MHNGQNGETGPDRYAQPGDLRERLHNLDFNHRLIKYFGFREKISNKSLLIIECLGQVDSKMYRTYNV
jgi:hypothetical protein